MKKLNYFILTCSITLLIILTIFIKFSQYPFTIINGHKFVIDIASSNQQKEEGLSIYSKLPSNKGMLFPFQTNGIYPFWMKNMKFSIDIIYINNNKIVEIFPSLPFPKTASDTPKLVTPKNMANYVLEINSGLSQKYNFKPGDYIYIHL